MLPEGDRHIKRQHEIIAELGCNGHNTQWARETAWAARTNRGSQPPSKELTEKSA
jgi:hypothetical protein